MIVTGCNPCGTGCSGAASVHAKLRRTWCTATTASAGAHARGMHALNCGQARGISMAL